MTKSQFQQKVQSGILFIRPQAFWKNGVCLWRVVKYTKKTEKHSFGWSKFDEEYGCKQYIQSKCDAIAANSKGKIEIG